MSSTNKTTNYELSQFLGTDKPAWLTDYNTDMGKIDTGIHTAQTTATGADGKATANTTAIGTLSNLTTTDKSSVVAAVNEVNTSAGSAQNTANTAVNLANGADGKVTALVNKFDLSTHLDYTNSTMSITNATFLADSHLYVARNTDGSLFKVYGRIGCTLTGGSLTKPKVTLPNTGITVDSAYDIICAGFAYQANSVNDGVVPVTLTIKNNSIEIEFQGRTNGQTQVMQLSPCLYFNSNFGDLPTPE